MPLGVFPVQKLGMVLNNFEMIIQRHTGSLVSMAPGANMYAFNYRDHFFVFSANLLFVDGLHPHLLSVQFISKVTIAKICLYIDSKADESYTPKKISIRCGSSYHDLVDIISLGESFI